MIEEKTGVTNGEHKEIRGLCSAALVVERDDGQYQIGWQDDAPGPFESRRFAECVAARTMPVLS